MGGLLEGVVTAGDGALIVAHTVVNQLHMACQAVAEGKDGAALPTLCVPLALMYRAHVFRGIRFLTEALVANGA